MEKVNISIIVPIFNAEATLSRCIDSLLNQSLKNIEIILINDGSSDKSGDICDKYADKYNCVRVAHQPNSGVSCARNLGIKIAKGEYIGFVDSDDFVDPNMFNLLFHESTKNNVDIANCNHYRGYENNMSPWPSDFKQEGIFVNEELFVLIRNAHDSHHSIWPVWTNIYRSSFLKQNNLKFLDSVQHCEDLIFNMYAFSLAGRLFHSNSYLYYHIKNKDSVTNSQYIENWPEKMEITFKHLFFFYQKIGLSDAAFCVNIATEIVESLVVWMLLNSWNGPHFISDIKKIRSGYYVSKLLNKYTATRKISFGFHFVFFLLRIKFYYIIDMIFKFKFGRKEVDPIDWTA